MHRTKESEKITKVTTDNITYRSFTSCCSTRLTTFRTRGFPSCYFMKCTLRTYGKTNTSILQSISSKLSLELYKVLLRLKQDFESSEKYLSFKKNLSPQFAKFLSLITFCARPTHNHIMCILDAKY